MDNTYELEENIIGSMILEHDCFRLAQDRGLLPNDLVNHAFKKAYEIMLDKNTNDIITIKETIKDNFYFQEIANAGANCISSAGFATWIDLIHQRSADRKLLKLATEIPGIVEEDIPTDQKVDKVNSLIISNKFAKNVGAPIQVQEILDIVEQEVINAQKENDNVIKTGYKSIDSNIGGFKKGDLIIVAGRPAMGKTTWALNVAANNLKKNKTVLVFSLEMTNSQLTKKFISAEAEIPMDYLLKGNMPKEIWYKFEKAKEFYMKQNLYLYDRAPITIETLINKTKSIHAVKNIDLIVIDYLQLLMTTNKIPSNSDSRATAITYISNLLKGLAKEMDCPIIALSQLNRGVESRENKKPVLSDLRDSGSIEQDADMVIMLYRDEYYNPIGSNMADIIVRKNRMGSTGDFQLEFNGSISKFTEIDDDTFAFIYEDKDSGPF
jgi:replicative DNA helicase